MKKKEIGSIIVLVVIAIILVVLIVLLLNKKENNSNEVSGEKKIEKIIKLENDYRRELIKNVHKYIGNSDLELVKEEDGKVLEINSKDIVKNGNYDDCNGKMIVTKVQDKYVYNPDISCGEKDDMYGESKYIVFDGTLLYSFNFGEETILVTSFNHKYKNTDVYTSGGEVEYKDTLSGWDALLTIVDGKGNIIRQERIIPDKYSEYSKVEVKNIVYNDGLYYAFVEVSYTYWSSTTVERQLLVFDKEDYWNITSYKASEWPFYYNFIGSEDNTYYYADNEKIYKIYKDEITGQIYNSSNDKYLLFKYYDNNYYGLGSMKNDGYKELVKFDDESNIVWKMTVEDERYSIVDIKIFEDKLYVLKNIEDNNNYDYDIQLSMYDLDGNHIRTFDVNKLFKDHKISQVKLVTVDNPKLIVVYDIHNDVVINFDSDLKKYTKDKVASDDLETQWPHYYSLLKLDAIDSSKEVRVYDFDYAKPYQELVVLMIKNLK